MASLSHTAMSAIRVTAYRILSGCFVAWIKLGSVAMDQGRKTPGRKLPVPATAHKDILQKFSLNVEMYLLSSQHTPPARDNFPSVCQKWDDREMRCELASQREKPRQRSSEWTKGTAETPVRVEVAETHLWSLIWRDPHFLLLIDQHEQQENKRPEETLQIVIRNLVQVHWAARSHNNTRNMSWPQVAVYPVLGRQNAPLLQILKVSHFTACLKCHK